MTAEEKEEKKAEINSMLQKKTLRPIPSMAQRIK